MQVLILAGNVGKAPELRRNGTGDPVLNFTIAVNNGKDSNGQERPASWYDCALWGKRAESLEGVISKGMRVTVSGRPTVRVHEGKAYLGVTVNELTLLGGGEKRDEAPRQQSGYGAGGRPGASDLDDEIPFMMEAR